MWQAGRQRRWAWLGSGLIVGIAVGAFMPHTPTHATATDRGETFAVCTGSVEDDLEALYFLDFLTGDLRAVVMSLNSSKFVGYFQYNVAADLATDGGKTPRYALVSGYARLRQNTGQLRPSHALLYVVEGTTGKVAAYTLPWNRNRSQAVQPFQDTLVLLDGALMRNVALRDN